MSYKPIGSGGDFNVVFFLVHDGEGGGGTGRALIVLTSAMLKKDTWPRAFHESSAAISVREISFFFSPPTLVASEL